MLDSAFQRTWTAYLAMVRKEFTILTRYPVSFVASFGQIFLIVAIFVLAGMMFSGRAPSGSLGAYQGFPIYGFVLYLFLSETLWNIGYNVRREQLQGTLEQLYLSPASKFASLVARVTHTLVWTSLLSVAGAGLMVAMMGGLPMENPLMGLYLFVMVLLGTFGVGFAFAALTLRLRETANTLANLSQFFFIVVCANFFPFSALPPALRAISRLIPLSYGVDAIRSTLMDFPPGLPELAPIGVEVVIVSAFGVLMPILGYGLYTRAEVRARQRGTLSAY